MTTNPHNATETLERLAVALESPIVSFDSDAARWLTEVAGERGANPHLSAIMNDVAESTTVRARAMAMLTADLLRG